MERIELFKFENPRIRISIELYFNEKGQLIFDGYDIGKQVEDSWGDSDYEYSYTIEPLFVERLFSILDVPVGDRYALLLELKKRFGNNKAYSQFGNFMKENNIEFRSFTWT